MSPYQVNWTYYHVYAKKNELILTYGDMARSIFAALEYRLSHNPFEEVSHVPKTHDYWFGEWATKFPGYLVRIVFQEIADQKMILVKAINIRNVNAQPEQRDY